MAFNGDMSNSTESPEQLYRDFIDASVGAFASETPILYNRGNHETRGIYADHLPEYFPKVGGNYYKLYMAGSVAVLLLDCGEDKPDSDIEYGGLGLTTPTARRRPPGCAKRSPRKSSATLRPHRAADIPLGTAPGTATSTSKSCFCRS